MRKQNFGSNGKGYYIALVLCAAAIGISGYLYYQNDGEQPPKTPQLQQSQSQDEPGTPVNPDVQAVATTPKQTDATLPTTPKVHQKPMKTGAPVAGETVAEYAMDCLSYNQTTRDWRVHNGVDIAAESGTEVCAAADGTVYSVFEDDTMGMTVVIRHADGYTTQYASLHPEVKVKNGQTVTLGQAIGCVGQTALLESAIGEHVHFSVFCNGEAVDPGEFLEME